MSFWFLNKKEKHVKMPGRIMSVSENEITLRLFNDHKYKKGQHLLVSIPVKRTTASGQSIWISDNIACGEVSKVINDEIVIQSSFNSPIIARLTIKENIGKKNDLLIDRFL